MDVTRTFQTLPMDASMMISVRIVRTIPSGGRVGGWTEEEMRPKRATQDSGACLVRSVQRPPTLAFSGFLSLGPLGSFCLPF